MTASHLYESCSYPNKIRNLNIYKDDNLYGEGLVQLTVEQDINIKFNMNMKLKKNKFDYERKCLHYCEKEK